MIIFIQLIIIETFKNYNPIKIILITEYVSNVLF